MRFYFLEIQLFDDYVQIFIPTQVKNIVTKY